MMITRIPLEPDASTTITDETTEHFIHHKRTIKIDRDYLMKKYPELFERLAKVAEKYPSTSNNRHVKKQGYGNVKK